MKPLDTPREYCGIIGIYGHTAAPEMAYLGLYSLQHRGQEGAGIVSTDGDQVYCHLGQGLVNDVFSSREVLDSLKGHIAVGHNRYSTTGSDKRINVQPLLVNSKEGPLALGHNGNLVNARGLREQLQNEGALFQTTTDTEIIVHLMARSRKESFIPRLKDALGQVRGAYSLVLMNKEKLVAARDPRGFRPLALGSLGKGYVVASETCAMDLIGAEYIRDVEPGEILTIDEDGLHSEFMEEKSTHAQVLRKPFQS